jgi:alpha-tubulin suppressor-like RCC1 family protein
MKEIGYLQSEEQEVVTMCAGRSGLVVWLVVLCFWAGTIQANEQGNIYGWGSQKLPNEQSLTDISQIAAGYGYSLALKLDGSIVGCGNDNYGQASPPSGNDFVAISAGWDHSLALKSDGLIVGWGGNSSGQATDPVGNDFVAIAAGDEYSLALKSDGSIVGWGLDDYDQASPPSTS